MTDENLTRVYNSISEAIISFLKQRLEDPELKGAFTSDQLRNYVINNVKGRVSPSSADRVLRELRLKYKVNYIVLNRAKSLYRAVPVTTPDSAERLTTPLV